MITSEKGLALIKSFEGCQLTAYKCPAGVWTIGWGHTGGVKQGQTITQAEADKLLQMDLKQFERGVENYDHIYHWNQNEFDALVSFSYNVGSIDGLTARGARSRETIAEKMLAYNKAAGKVLAGLTRRRKAEQELFLSPCAYSAPIPSDNISAHVRSFQAWLGVTADGRYGPETRKAAIRALQQAINDLHDTKLTVDGVFGPKTKAACGNTREGDGGRMVHLVQGLLYCHGYDPGFLDWSFGPKTKAAVLVFQKAKGLSADGIVGPNTWEKLASAR